MRGSGGRRMIPKDSKRLAEVGPLCAPVTMPVPKESWLTVTEAANRLFNDLPFSVA